jgi:hypothetical protein
MSTRDDKHVMHMLDGLGEMPMPHTQHRLTRESKKHKEIVNSGLVLSAIMATVGAAMQ